MLGLLLEGVQHVHDAREANGIDGAIRVTVEIIHDLQHASSAESLERFGVGCLATNLRVPERATDSPADFLWKAPQILLAAPDPTYWLGLWSCVVPSRHRRSLEQSMLVQA